MDIATSNTSNFISHGIIYQVNSSNNFNIYSDIFRKKILYIILFLCSLNGDLLKSRVKMQDQLKTSCKHILSLRDHKEEDDPSMQESAEACACGVYFSRTSVQQYMLVGPICMNTRTSKRPGPRITTQSNYSSRLTHPAIPTGRQ